MASLLDIPSELLDSIIQRLEADSLASMTRTCKRLRSIAEPWLYSSTKLTWKHDQNHPRIASLLNTVIQRPDLASLITTVDFSGHKPRGSRTRRKFTRRNFDPSISVWNGNAAPSDSDKKAVKGLLDQLGLLSTDDLWYRDYLAGEVDVFVALILSRLSNLRTLRLSSEFQCDTKFIGQMLKSLILSPESPNRLKSLTQVEYGRDVQHFLDVEGLRVQVDQIWPLFHLPSMTEFSAVALDMAQIEREELSQPSPVKSMKLRYCRNEYRGLCDLIELSTHQLTNLDLHVAIEMDDATGPLFLESPVFVKALQGVASSLKHLRMSTTLYSMYGDGFWSQGSLAGRIYGPAAHSLRFLTSLEDLDIPIVSLFGWSSASNASSESMSGLIPPNLRSLTLTDEATLFEDYEWDDEALLDRIGPLLQDVRTSESNLEIFTLKIPETDESWFEDAEKRLRHICQEAGVRCQIVRQ